MTDGTISGPTLTVPGDRERWWAKARTSFFCIVTVAFALRFGYIVVRQTYTIHSNNHHLVVQAEAETFDFGFEIGRIARSLPQGTGFSSPFNGTTGPTAWEPPLYPYLVAP